ncbi:acetylxylan esterase [Planotetraspora sp. A-T 1434]
MIEPERCYYRCVFIDVARGVEAIRSLDEVDPPARRHDGEQ